MARSAKRLIVSCERLITNDEIRSNPARTAIPYYCVDAVCEAPLGSYPGNMPYEYYSDEEHIRQWLTVEEDPDEFSRFLGITCLVSTTTRNTSAVPVDWTVSRNSGDWSSWTLLPTPSETSRSCPTHPPTTTRWS